MASPVHRDDRKWLLVAPVIFALLGPLIYALMWSSLLALGGSFDLGTDHNESLPILILGVIFFSYGALFLQFLTAGVAFVVGSFLLRRTSLWLALLASVVALLMLLIQVTKGGMQGPNLWLQGAEIVVMFGLSISLCWWLWQRNPAATFFASGSIFGLLAVLAWSLQTELSRLPMP